MTFRMAHENFNVLDLGRSLPFYREALGLTEKRRRAAPDGSFVIVYLANGASDFELELPACGTAPNPTISARGNFIWPSGRISTRKRKSCTGKWAASALKTLRWAAISLKIPTVTGSKSCRKKRPESACKSQ